MVTYTGWLWTHGCDYYDEEAAIRQMYSQPQNSPYFDAYGIEFVVIGPFERREYGADTLNFQENFTVIKQTSIYTILKLQ